MPILTFFDSPSAKARLSAAELNVLSLTGSRCSLEPDHPGWPSNSSQLSSNPEIKSSYLIVRSWKVSVKAASVRLNYVGIVIIDQYERSPVIIVFGHDGCLDGHSGPPCEVDAGRDDDLTLVVAFAVGRLNGLAAIAVIDNGEIAAQNLPTVQARLEVSFNCCSWSRLVNGI